MECALDSPASHDCNVFFYSSCNAFFLPGRFRFVEGGGAWRLSFSVDDAFRLPCLKRHTLGSFHLVTFFFVQELDLLEDSAPVFKLVGPVLMKQDLEEAKQNVAKRLELIEREM